MQVFDVSICLHRKLSLRAHLLFAKAPLGPKQTAVLLRSYMQAHLHLPVVLVCLHWFSTFNDPHSFCVRQNTNCLSHFDRLLCHRACFGACKHEVYEPSIHLYESASAFAMFVMLLFQNYERLFSPFCQNTSFITLYCCFGTRALRACRHEF